MNIDRAQLLPKSGLGIVGPWLVVSPSPNYVTRLDLRILDSIEVAGFWRRYLVMRCGPTEVRIRVSEGRAAAGQLALAARSHTRGTGFDATRCLYVDDQALEVHEDYLRFGQLPFRLAEVRYYAKRMATIPLTNGRLVHAALGALAIAAHERANPRV